MVRLSYNLLKEGRDDVGSDLAIFEVGQTLLVQALSHLLVQKLDCPGLYVGGFGCFGSGSARSDLIAAIFFFKLRVHGVWQTFLN